MIILKNSQIQPLSTCAHNGQIHYFLAHNAHLKKNDLKNSQK